MSGAAEASGTWCNPRVPADFPQSAIYSGRSPLGCSGNKPVRNRITSRLPGAAAPTLVGVAAAFSLSALVTAGPASASTTAHHAAATHKAAVSVARVLSAHKATAAKKAAASLPAKYTVRSGDTLSSIAGNFYHNPDAWPVLYWANHSQIRWANEISTGQVLNVPVMPAKIPAAPGQLGPAPAPAPTAAPARTAPASTEQASTEQASTEQAAPVQSAPVAHAASTYAGSGSLQQCIISRESGGNSQVMNSSGHYGLYQFSSSTWAAYGGNPADFGHASVSEQNQVYSNAIAKGGASNWTAYDGC